MLRVAERSDVDALMRIRAAVKENRLVSRVIPASEVIDQIERTGRGWVHEIDGEIAGFAIGNRDTASIWALFIDPQYEGRGIGRALHDEMLEWLWSQGLTSVWLTTDPGTRAESFYRNAGWRDCGIDAHGERRFEMERP